MLFFSFSENLNRRTKATKKNQTKSETIAKVLSCFVCICHACTFTKLSLICVTVNK